MRATFVIALNYFVLNFITLIQEGEKIGLRRSTTLKCILREKDGKLQAGLVCLSRTSGRLLLSRLRHFGFTEMWRISCVVGKTISSFYSMALVMVSRRGWLKSFLGPIQHF